MTPPTPPAPDRDRTHRAAITILIDADACPVKEEVYRVAARFKAPLPEAHVRVVSNSPFRIPDNPRIKRVVVDDGFDAADDWIAQEAVPSAYCVTKKISGNFEGTRR